MLTSLASASRAAVSGKGFAAYSLSSASRAASDRRVPGMPHSSMAANASTFSKGCLMKSTVEIRSRSTSTRQCMHAKVSCVGWGEGNFALVSRVGDITHHDRLSESDLAETSPNLRINVSHQPVYSRTSLSLSLTCAAPLVLPSRRGRSKSWRIFVPSTASS